MFSDDEQSFNKREKLPFDPWALGSDHMSHNESTSIVAIEGSGKVFCPLCLENIPAQAIKDIEDSEYDTYIDNLFEALNEHYERDTLRKVLLPLLEKLLRNRPINVSNDHNLHNLLRIIFKIINCYNFGLHDFPNLASIFSIISGRIESESVPMMSVWKTAKHFLDYADAKVADTVDKSNNNECRYLGSLIMIIRTFLYITRQFSIDRVSDLIFPLVERGNQEVHQRRYQKESQSKCLIFMKNYLMPKVWPQLMSLERSFNMKEKPMFGDLFRALKECFHTAIRLDDRDFLESLINNDCLNVAHNVIYRNSEASFRSYVRDFLHPYIDYYVGEYLGSDQVFKKFMITENIVETNHQNAKTFCADKLRYTRTIFYLLVNCVAHKQKSKFYIPIRLKRVLKIVEPKALHIGASRTLTRAYLYVAASLGPESWYYDNMATFVRQLWSNSGNFDINEIFCSDSTIFRWVYERPGFLRLTTAKTVKYLLENQNDSRYLLHHYKLLMRTRHYRSLIQSYIKEENSAQETLSKILEFNDQKVKRSRTGYDDRDAQDDELAGVLMSTLDSCFLEFINDFNRIQLHDKIFRVLETIVNLLKHYSHLTIILDDQFIEDLFKFTEKMHQVAPSESLDEVLSNVNDFITYIIRVNNPSLMKVLRRLDYSILGYMLSRLADYTKDDHYVESVARLLLAYDDLDYPLINDVKLKMVHMSMSSINWMLSRAKELHLLSLRVLKTIWIRDPESRIYIVVGLLQLLTAYPELLNNPMHLEVFKFMLVHKELEYNALLKSAQERMPRAVRELIEARIRETCPSPTPSFESDGSSVFEEEHTAVTQILSKLHQDDRNTHSNDNYSLPPSLFMSSFVREPHRSSMETNDWEKIANEGNNNNDDLAPL